MARHAIPLVILMACASPAAATGSLECVAGDDIALRGSVGHVVGSPLVAVTLREGDTNLSSAGETPKIAVARSWLDADEIRVDLADANLNRMELELRARKEKDGVFVGTLRRDGQSRPVRCTLD